MDFIQSGENCKKSTSIKKILELPNLELGASFANKSMDEALLKACKITFFTSFFLVGQLPSVE